MKHTLATVAAGTSGYPPTDVHLERRPHARVCVALHQPETSKGYTEWEPMADLLDDPGRLHIGLESMLRTVWRAR